MRKIVFKGTLQRRRSGWLWLAVILPALVALAVSSAARADDAYWSGGIGGVGQGFTVDVVHNDGGLFKGWLNITATNTGTQPWGDFHFGIYDPIGGQDISNVGFLDSTTVPPGFDPTSTQSPLTWTINNVVVGATMDLYFYDDPVLGGETATFSVYTSNPDHLSFFGVMIYPTPVPEPASLLMLGLGGLLLLRRR
jgi:hypothetical protein